MAEARGLRDIREGRTGDPITATLAVVVGGLAARAAYRNSQKVRDFTHYAGKKMGVTTNPPPPPPEEPDEPGALPKGWTEHVTKSGKKYYHNKDTNKSQFVQPRKPPPDPNALPSNWEEHDGEDGQKFYYNTNTHESVFDRPLPTPKRPPAVVGPPPVTQMKSKKNRNKQSGAVAPIEQAPTQPTPNKGRNKQAAGAPRIDAFAARIKTAKYILGSDALTKLITKLDTAVAALQKRVPEVDAFVASNYKLSIEKYDVEALKAEGLKRRPAIVLGGDNKTEMLDRLVQAEFNANDAVVKSWKTAVAETETELATLKATITTAAASQDPEQTIFKPVITGLELFTKKLAKTTTAYNQLKFKLGKPGNKLMTLVLGSISACRAVVLQYMADLARMRK